MTTNARDDHTNLECTRSWTHTSCSEGFSLRRAAVSSQGKTTSDSECKDCPQNMYKDTIGAGSCLPKTYVSCPAGQGFFGESPRKDSTCVPCNDANSSTLFMFNTKDGTSSCSTWTTKTCPPGEEWVAGTSMEDSSCIPCADGFYSLSKDNLKCVRFTEIQCPIGEGKVDATLTSDSFCETCKNGKFSNTTYASGCIPWSLPSCSSGKGYAPGDASSDSQCFTCPKGTFSEEGNVGPCTACNVFTCKAGEGYQPGSGYLRANRASSGGGNLAVEGKSSITGIDIVLGESESGGGVMLYPGSTSTFFKVNFE